MAIQPLAHGSQLSGPPAIKNRNTDYSHPPPQIEIRMMPKVGMTMLMQVLYRNAGYASLVINAGGRTVRVIIQQQHGSRMM